MGGRPNTLVHMVYLAESSLLAVLYYDCVRFCLTVLMRPLFLSTIIRCAAVIFTTIPSPNFRKKEHRNVSAQIIRLQNLLALKHFLLSAKEGIPMCTALY